MSTSIHDIKQDFSEHTRLDRETYGLFMTPVSKFNIEEFVDPVLKWMKNQDFVEINERAVLCHNVQQVGKTNQILKDMPDLEQQLMECVHFHNNEGLNYASEFRINDVYVEVAHQGAIYAPHEHANCVFSGTFFINYDQEAHSFLKFKRQVQSQMFPVMMLPFKQMTAFNLQEATVPFKKGDVVIYPSKLTHGYESNQTDNRITLTFNVVPA